MSNRIFIIEDDSTLREETAKLLDSYGYDCAYTDDFKNAVEHILSAQADLVLLDINLPYYDGFYVCREIRKHSDVPIIFITSRNRDEDELMGMNLGADDFVTKPFNTQILLARISAVLKRAEPAATDTVTHNGLCVNLSRGVAEAGKLSAELTKNEVRILSMLIKHAGAVVSRDELIDELWQSDEFIDDNTLTVNINRLRHKLETLGLGDYIVTKRGRGYIV